MNITKTVTKAFGTNCYLLQNKDSAIIIDPGELTPELLEFAKTCNKKENRAILLTHCHYDHIAAVNEVKAIFDAEVYISEPDAKGLQSPDVNVSNFLTGNEFSITADKTLKDKEILVFGNDKIEVMFTPGHTIGSVCFILEDVIFSGDTLFKMNIGRYDLPTSNPRKLLESLNKLKNLQGNYAVFAGHGDETTLS